MVGGSRMWRKLDSEEHWRDVAEEDVTGQMQIIVCQIFISGDLAYESYEDALTHPDSDTSLTKLVLLSDSTQYALSETLKGR